MRFGGQFESEDAGSLEQTMEKERLPWRSFADDQGAICSRWNVNGTPTFYVLDPEGVIQHKWLANPGAKVIDAALEELLREVQPGSTTR